MPGKTNTEKIEELYTLCHKLEIRAEVLERDVSLLAPLTAKVAVLEQQITDLNKRLEALTARLWQIGIPLIVAAFGALLAALLRK
jgi:hypothetical protein